MAKIWFNRVYTGGAVFDDVPTKYRDKVINIAMEWVEAERMTKDELTELFGVVIESPDMASESEPEEGEDEA